MSLVSLKLIGCNLLQETRQNSTSQLTSIQKQIEAAKSSQNEKQAKVKEIEAKIVQLEKKRDKVRHACYEHHLLS